VPESGPTNPSEVALLKIIDDIRKVTADIEAIGDKNLATLKTEFATDRRRWLNGVLEELRANAATLESFIRRLTPARIEDIRITLGRADSIAKYFAFVFVNQDRYPLASLAENPFYGSGVYAIYYIGSEIPAYAPLAHSETPIYLGKADPKLPYAEGSLRQGMSLHARLVEHTKSIVRGGLDLKDFECRYATIQSGMQAAVEDFLIRLFLPIWNKEIKICYGIGKHGDAAETRRNRRSPWDTMHPGRKWAEATTEDQSSREIVVQNIATHFGQNPPFADRDALVTKLISS
jgi:hypothetical protein